MRPTIQSGSVSGLSQKIEADRVSVRFAPLGGVFFLNADVLSFLHAS